MKFEKCDMIKANKDTTTYTGRDVSKGTILEFYRYSTVRDGYLEAFNEDGVYFQVKVTDFDLKRRRKKI